MQAIGVLSAVLALQSQAAPLVDQEVAEYYINKTTRALSEEMLRLPTEIDDNQPLTGCRTVTEEDKGAVALRDGSGCRALLLELIKRAAHDWILYRFSRKPERAYAHSAHVWLFEEEPGHPLYEARKKIPDGMLTSFLEICDLLDLEPDAVRDRVRRMTRKDIQSSGRPAESRRVGEGVEDYTSPSELDGFPADDRHATTYEEQFMVYTY